ncbi:MAG: nucleotidyltransferase domain-containing protein [Actinobacteria bacterium]|nr:MAG: nucleotidyltransferase domain-containing protein [Actinomycetota bacterium]
MNNLKKDYKIDKIILFGSRARKDYLKYSDYDFIIVSPDFENIHFLTRISLMYKYWPSDITLEAICYTPQEFAVKSKQISLASEALKEGIEITAA